MGLGECIVGQSRSRGASATSTSLLDRVRVRDPEAWRRLVKLYGPTVYRWFRQAGLQGSDAADLSQEVFQAVILGIARFRKARPEDTFRGWLWTIARNKVRDHARRGACRARAAGGTTANYQMQQVPDLTPEADEPAEDSGFTRRVLELLQGEFEERTWRAFWRSAIDGCPAAAVAEELQMSPGAVRQAKYRVLQRLREELDTLR